MDDERDEGDADDPKGLPEPSTPHDPESEATPDPDADPGPDPDALPGIGDDEDSVPIDLPSDVDSALTQLVGSARVAIRAGRTDTALAAVESARTVAQTKLPDGEHKDRLLHGCDRVTDLAAADPSVAAEYLDAMRRRLP